MTTQPVMSITDEQLAELEDSFAPFDGHQSTMIKALITRLREAEADNWIPIESAPLDGSEILLMRGERVTSGAWIEWTSTCPEYHSSTGAYLGQSEQDSGASWASWDGGFTEEEPPTHWKRLPKPQAMERTP